MSKIPSKNKKAYVAPKIKRLNDISTDKEKKMRKSRAQGPPSMPGPAATSPSTPAATVF